MEAALSGSLWLAGREFSLADVGYAPYITRLDHLQMQFMWGRRPQHAGWYDRLRQRRFYSEALEKWFNAAYLALMKEKGAEVQSRVKAIVGGFDPGARVSLRQKTGASFVIEEIVETILSKKVENEAA